MFKKKSSIKAVLSAVMASFLFCLCLGKFAFAELICDGLINDRVDISYRFEEDELIIGDVTHVRVIIKNLSNETKEYKDAWEDLSYLLNAEDSNLSHINPDLYLEFTEASNNKLQNFVLHPKEKVEFEVDTIVIKARHEP